MSASIFGGVILRIFVLPSPTKTNNQNKMRGAPPYDHIVIETTGIAEPKAIRANFQEAEDYGT